MAIKNIVFDIGNVLLKWAPLEIVTKTFPDYPDHQQLTLDLVKSQIWFDLNLGKINENQAIALYHKELEISISKLEEFITNVKKSLVPLPGSIELLDKLYIQNIPLYTITDNIKELVSYTKQKYNFWEKFKGAVVSADIGFLKPSPEIYLHLLNTYKLIPEETLFFDDIERNVEGAKKVGIHASIFTTADECKEILKTYNINV
jgi:putative hydrolase of the HAD superfamily